MKQIFVYKGSEITFLSDNDVMVNATEMAKAFGKRPVDWLRLPSSQRYIETLREVRFSHLTNDENPLVITVNGNYRDSREQGTWLHEDVALEFARWLSPSFAIWCNDRIKELMRHGATAMNPEDLLNPDFIINLATALKNERAEKEALQQQNHLQVLELQKAAPKVQYHDAVINSNSLVSITEMANELGFSSAIKLNKFLFKIGIIRKVNDTWALRAELSGRGLAKYKTITFTDSQGETRTRNHLYFTQAGRKYVHDYINKHQLL